MNFGLRLSCIAALVVVTALPTKGFADENFTGVTMAKFGPNAVFIWKTNDAVAALASQNVTGDQQFRSLLSEGAKILVAELKKEPSSTRSVSLELIYIKAGGIDPNYKIATVAGIEKVATLEALYSDYPKYGAGWPSALESGLKPDHLIVKNDHVNSASTSSPAASP
jgi:hypothetical protein